MERPKIIIKIIILKIENLIEIFDRIDKNAVIQD